MTHEVPRLALTSFLLLLAACGGHIEHEAEAEDPAGPTVAKNDPAVASEAPGTLAPWSQYPAGPYGVDMKGQTFPRLKLSGYIGGEGGTWGTIDLIDFYDPTGERGICGVVVTVNIRWCPPSNVMASHLDDWYTRLYRPRGAKMLEILLQDKTATEPATQATADYWIGKYHLGFDTAVDPEQTSMPRGGASVPRTYVVNPRDMMIIRINAGFDPYAYDGIAGFRPVLDTNCPVWGP